MADISKIKIDTTTYDIRDETSRTLAQEAKQATNNLGTLAYQDNASGTFTPSGSISKPNITLTGVSQTVKSCTDVGSLPQWSASVNSEVLEFTFDAGSLPTVSNVTIDNISAAELTAAPAFTGNAGTITVQ